MKSLGTYLMNSPAAVVLAVVGVAGLVVSLVWPLHGAAWLCLLVFALLILAGLALAGREWLSTQAKIDTLRSELSAARAQVSGLTAVAVDPRDTPSDDQRAAARIVELLPTETGLVERLRLDPGAGRVPADELAAARAFVAEFANATFADRATHFAFMELYRTAHSFIEWIDAETTETDGVAELIPGDERPDGWRSYSSARAQGEAAASALTRARREFQRTALTDGVLSEALPHRRAPIASPAAPVEE